MVSRCFISALAITLAMAGGSGMLTGCTQAETSEIDHLEPVTVRVAPVTTEQETAPLRFPGTVKARQRAVLTFQVSGTVRSRPVTLGQAVEKGELLAKLYNPQLEPARDSAKAKLRELQAQAEQSERELERAEQLHKRGVQSVQGLEQARAANEGFQASVATARAALAEAEQMVDETEMRAPFAGRIQSISVEPGEFVNVGEPVIGLSAGEGVEVEIRVPEYLLAGLRVGDEIPVWLVRQREPGDRGQVAGRIAEIAQPSGDNGQLQTLIVHLIEPSAPLEPETPLVRAELSESPTAAPMAPVPVAGTPVEVGISTPVQGALSVPMLAVMRARDSAAVFKVEGSKVRRVPVRVVRLLGEDVLVSSAALAPDDRVVFAGLSRLIDGDTVEVLQ